MELIDVLIRSGQAGNQKEAQEIFNEMQERIHEGEDPEEVLEEYGLEPDYVFDIIDF